MARTRQQKRAADSTRQRAESARTKAVTTTAIFGVAAVIGPTWVISHALRENAKSVGTVTSPGSTCTIEFTDTTGTQHEYVDDGGKTGCHYRLGQHVTIHYDPANPHDASLGAPVVLIAVMSAFIVLGLALLAAVFFPSLVFRRRLGVARPAPRSRRRM